MTDETMETKTDTADDLTTFTTTTTPRPSTDTQWDPSIDLINLHEPGIEPVRDTLTDSLADWMSHKYTDFTVDCVLCTYSPLKCKGSCSYSSWASADKRWIEMHNKELKYIHDKCYMAQDPQGVRQMRAKVLDWIFEVTAFYILQRQTAYMAQDFLDRYLMTQDLVEKSSLQLVATTAFFIAAKKEETNRPKIAKLASLTARACSVCEIQHMEVEMLKALKWQLSPATAVAWLNIYAQTEIDQSEEMSLKPFFTQEIYIQITELLDLCIMDIDSLDYNYSALAAAAICHFSSYDVVHRISGVSWKSLSACYWWMSPFKDSLQFDPQPELWHFPQINPKYSHHIQTHEVKRSLLRRAQGGLMLGGMMPVGMSSILTPSMRTLYSSCSSTSWTKLPRSATVSDDDLDDDDDDEILSLASPRQAQPKEGPAYY